MLSIESAKAFYYRHRSLAAVLATFLAGGVFVAWGSAYLEAPADILALEAKHEQDVKQVNARIERIEKRFDRIEGKIDDARLFACISAQELRGRSAQSCREIIAYQ